MQRTEHDFIRIGEIALVLLVDLFQNLIQGAFGVLHCPAAFLGRNVSPVNILQLYRAGKGFLKLVILQAQLSFQIDRIILMAWQQT